MRIALIANPTSGRGRHGGAAHVAIIALITAGHDVVVAHCSSYSDSRANATALLERDGGLDALVVVGGDGTVHLGLDVGATTGVPLGIVAVGTGNDIARHLRLPRRDVTASVAVIDAALRGEGRVARLDAVHATRPDGSRPQVVTMPRREPVTTLNEELRRLSPDLVYQEVLTAFAADHGCRVAHPRD